MSEAAYIPLEFTRGNDEEIIFEFENEDLSAPDISGDKFVFRAVDAAGNEVWRKATEDLTDEMTIYDTQSIYLWITEDETRNATSRAITYTVEHRTGTPEKRKSIFKGPIKMITDANDDV